MNMIREGEEREEQREGASKLRHRVVLAVGAAVAAWMIGALILLALSLFWEDQVATPTYTPLREVDLVEVTL